MALAMTARTSQSQLRMCSIHARFVPSLKVFGLATLSGTDNKKGLRPRTARETRAGQLLARGFLCGFFEKAVDNLNHFVVDDAVLGDGFL
jgi:hypothetical protein